MKSAFMVWNDVFTAAELDAFEAYGDRMVLQRAALAVAQHIDDGIRIARIAWLERKPETSILYERVTQVVRRRNDEICHFDVTGLESIQYTSGTSTAGRPIPGRARYR
jgi:hypothetical protein